MSFKFERPNRTSDSIALNIAEGSILQSNADFRKFLGYAIRSLAEVVKCLYKAKYRHYNLMTYSSSASLFNLPASIQI
ncbi:MAG: four helix bundle protein [Weeksellaceae bacterium]|nr:four helix bundle protein [Weeksellaceae bacterium]